MLLKRSFNIKLICKCQLKLTDESMQVLFMAITKTRNGESGKGIGEWGMGNEEW